MVTLTVGWQSYSFEFCDSISNGGALVVVVVTLTVWRHCGCGWQRWCSFILAGGGSNGSKQQRKAGAEDGGIEGDRGGSYSDSGGGSW